MKADRPIRAVLPLTSLWRAGFLPRSLLDRLTAAGFSDLVELSRWSRLDLMRATGLPEGAITQVEKLLERYCLGFTPQRRRRFRRPGRRLDPY